MFWIVVFGFLALAFLLCWGSYEAVIRYVHYYLGAMISCFLIVLAGGLMTNTFEESVLPELNYLSKEDRKVREAQLKVSFFAVKISASMTSVLILITLFAWVSYVRVQLGFG